MPSMDIITRRPALQAPHHLRNLKGDLLLLSCPKLEATPSVQFSYELIMADAWRARCCKAVQRLLHAQVARLDQVGAHHKARAVEACTEVHNITCSCKLLTKSFRVTLQACCGPYARSSIHQIVGILWCRYIVVSCAADDVTDEVTDVIGTYANAQVIAKAPTVSTVDSNVLMRVLAPERICNLDDPVYRLLGGEHLGDQLYADGIATSVCCLHNSSQCQKENTSKLRAHFYCDEKRLSLLACTTNFHPTKTSEKAHSPGCAHKSGQCAPSRPRTGFHDLRGQ